MRYPHQRVSQLLAITQMLAITQTLAKHKNNTRPCTSDCKAVTESDVQSIVSLRQLFDKTIDQFRQDLYTCDDGCPNTHIEKFSHYDPDENQFVFCTLVGHPLVCSNNSSCQSKLRILCTVATHYPRSCTSCTL